MEATRSPQKEKKDQFVIAYLTDLEQVDKVMSHACYLSKMINKGLILTHISDPRYTSTTTGEAESRLKEIVDEWSSQHSGFAMTYAALKGNSREVISLLPTLLNAVAVVAEVDRHAARRKPTSKQNLLRDFGECKVAYLTVQDVLDGEKPYSDVAMAIDFRKESKEKYIWASYFARFNSSAVHVLYYDYKDEFLHHKWYSNMKFLHRLYSNLNITFQPHIMESKSTFPDINALRFAHSQGYSLLVSITTKERDGLEFFMGVQESRTLVNKERIPVLFLNPREDLYVICD